MRVLTQYEREQFDIAFLHIMGVASCYEENKTNQLYQIRHGMNLDTGQPKPLPTAYTKLTSSIGGFQQLSHLFTPVNREETTERLIRYCFNTKTQPSAFEIEGFLSFIPIESRRAPEVHEYKESA